jgi:YD repeat-containing protein
VHRNNRDHLLGSESYVYDAKGRLTQKTVQGQTTEYEFDALGRLTGEEGPNYTAAYTYDANGNRLTKTWNSQTTNYSYNSVDRLTSAGSASYGYDAEGRRTSMTVGQDVTAYGYDYDNRLKLVTFPNSSTNTFAYNGLGSRVGKTDSAGTWTYAKAGASPGSPVLSDGFAVYTPGISERRNNVTTYYHWDVGGNLSWTSGSGQTLADFRQFDWFGMVVAGTAPANGGKGFGGNAGGTSEGDTGWIGGGGGGFYDAGTGQPPTPTGVIPTDDGRTYADGPLPGTGPTPGYWGQVGQVFIGYGKAIWGTATAPQQMALFLYHNWDDPAAIANLPAAMVVGFWDDLTSGDPERFGEAFGTVLIGAGTAGAGGAGGAAGGVSRGMRVYRGLWWRIQRVRPLVDQCRSSNRAKLPAGSWLAGRKRWLPPHRRNPDQYPRCTDTIGTPARRQSRWLAGADHPESC